MDLCVGVVSWLYTGHLIKNVDGYNLWEAKVGINEGHVTLLMPEQKNLVVSKGI